MTIEPSALKDVATVVRRAAAILRSHRGLIGRGFLAACGLPMTFSIVGVPVVGRWLVSSYRIALGRDDGEGVGWGVLVWAGLAHAATQLAAMFTTVTIALVVSSDASASSTAVTVAVGTGLGVVGATVGAAASTVATAAATRGGLAEGLARVLAVLGARPAGLSLALAAQVAAQLGAAAAIGAVLHRWLVAAELIGLVWASVAHLAFAAATEETVLTPRASDRFAPPVGRLAATLVVPVAVLGIALATSVAVPGRAWLVASDALARGEPVADRVVLREEARLVVTRCPAPDGDGRTICVTTADGGGAGRIDGIGAEADDDRSGGALRVRRTAFRGRSAWEIGRPGGRATYVDDDGVRLDDGLLDRLRERALPIPTLLAGVATLLVVVLARRLRATRTVAALLASGRATDADAAATVLVPGKLVLADGASVVWVGGDRWTVRGSVRFESDDGARSFALPEGDAVLDAREDASIGSGTRAFAIFAARELRARSYRDGAAARPLVLGLGAIDRAREAFVTHASRTLLRLALPAGGLFLVAALVLFVRTL